MDVLGAAGSVFSLERLARARASQEGGPTSRADADQRTLLVDVPPDFGDVKPYSVAWQYYLYALLHVPLRAVGSVPFHLKFSTTVRDWRVLPGGRGVELRLSPDCPVTVWELADWLEKFNSGRQGVDVSVTRVDGLVVIAPGVPPWSVFPVFVPVSETRQRAETARVRIDVSQERGYSEWYLRTSDGRVLVLRDGAACEPTEVGPAEIPVGGTLAAASRLVAEWPDRVLVTSRPARVGCVLINPDAVSEPDDRRALAGRLLRAARDAVLPGPLYRRTSSLLPVEAVSRETGRRRSSSFERTQGGRAMAVELLVPDRDTGLEPVFAGGADRPQGQGIRVVSLPENEWAARVRRGQYALAYWEFDWRYGEWTVLEAFFLRETRPPGVPYLPIRDATTQALLQLVQSATSPRQWRAALRELDHRLMAEGYVIPLWEVPEFARVPRALMQRQRLASIEELFRPYPEKGR